VINAQSDEVENSHAIINQLFIPNHRGPHSATCEILLVEYAN